MNVFLRELNAYKNSTITWAVSLSLTMLMFMALYPAFTSDVEATRAIMSNLPEAVRVALNISLSNFFTIYGFFGYLLGLVILAGSIQAMNLGVGVISKEVAGKTADFLLSKPIARTTVVTAKLAAALVMILATNMVFTAVAYFTAESVSKEPLDAQTFFLMASTLLLVQLMFFALGALFSVIIPKVKSVVSVSLPTVFAFFIIGAIGDVVGADEIRYISPFRYYDTNYIIENVRLEGLYLGIEAAFVVAAIALSYVIFIKKDVRSST